MSHSGSIGAPGPRDAPGAAATAIGAGAADLSASTGAGGRAGAACAIGAVVLAAGRSSRMGAPKPLLPVGRVTAVERVVGALRGAGVEPIVVVVGHEAEALIPLLDTLGVVIAFNRDYDAGMFSSVQTGAAALSPGLDTFFVWPVDHPLVRPAVIRALRRGWSERGLAAGGGPSGLIIHPTCCGRRGHPPLLAASYRSVILSADRGATLHDVLAAHDGAAEEIEVEDLTILMDMDTPADHRVFQRFATILDEEAAGPRSLTDEEALFILATLGTPENVVRHCRAVAAVGHEIAAALAPHLPHIDPAVVRTACLLHDMVRTLPGHATVAQRLLANLGLPELGALVGRHMVMEPDLSAAPGITETELAYLADKVVAEDEVVGLDGREARALTKMRSWPEATPAAFLQMGERMQSARRVAAKVEAVLGYPLGRLLAQARLPGAEVFGEMEP